MSWKDNMWGIGPLVEKETGSKVYQEITRKCPRCGHQLSDDGKWSIWCNKCGYKETVEGEPLDIGEVW